MTRARDLANIISGGFTVDDLPTLTASEIPNLDAAKITSGTFADARIAASSVNQHATSFDDNKLLNDISTLGLRVHTQENLNASNTNSASFDVFQDNSGVTNLTNASYNAAEFISSNTISFGSDAYETGDQRSNYTVTHANVGTITGNILNGLDEDNANNTSSSWYFNSGSLGSTSYIAFDLGSGNEKYYTGFRQTQSSSGNGGVWKVQGSNDATNFTDLSANFTWGQTNNQYITWSNDTAYRYIYIRGVSGNVNGSPWQEIIQFRTKAGTGTYNATGSFEGNAITAASTNKMGAVITYQDFAGTNTLNTDIILKLSADNGSNYSTATLTALPDFATGIKMAKINDLSVTAGTQLKYKIEFANQASGSKEARIRGVSLQY
jgi:hypothetical protein